MRLPRCRVSAYTGTALQGGGQYIIVRPTSQDFAPPTAFAKTQAQQVYRAPISTLSKICGTPKLDDNDPKIIPRSATVCPRLIPIAATARITQSQPGAPTGCRILPIRLPPSAIRAQESLLKVHNTL